MLSIRSHPELRKVLLLMPYVSNFNIDYVPKKTRGSENAVTHVSAIRRSFMH